MQLVSRLVCSGGESGIYFLEILVGMCFPVPQILPLFQTKNVILHTRFQTWAQTVLARFQTWNYLDYNANIKSIPNLHVIVLSYIHLELKQQKG